MRIALDTNRYTDFCRGDPKVLEVLQRTEEIFLPTLFDRDRHFDHLPQLPRLS